MTNVKIPTPLRKFTKDQGTVEADGETVAELIEDLEKNYPGIKKRLLDEKGEIRKFINIYADEEDIRFLQGKATKTKDKKEITIVPAIAGGG